MTICLPELLENHITKGNCFTSAQDELLGCIKPQKPGRGQVFFFFETSCRSQKMQQVPKWYKRKTQATSGPPGSKHRAPSRTPPTFPFASFLFFCLRQVAWGLPSSAGFGQGPATAGNFPLPRQRQCREGAPFAGSGRQARRPGPSPRAGREAPPRRAPSPAPLQGPPLQSWRRGDTPHQAASSGPAEPGRASRTRPSPGPAPSPLRRTPRCERSREPARRPVPAPLFARGTGQGAPATVGYSARPHRARPSAPQLTGTWRAAGHYSIAGSAGRSRLSGGKANCDREAPAGREARARGCPAQSARPRRRPGQARRGSRARRRKGRATMCRGGGGGGDASGSHNPARRRRARVSGNPNTSTGNRNPD